MSGSSLRKVRRLLMDAPLEKIGDLTRRQLRAMIHEELGEDVDIGKDELDSLYTSIIRERQGNDENEEAQEVVEEEMVDEEEPEGISLEEEDDEDEDVQKDDEEEEVDVKSKKRAKVGTTKSPKSVSSTPKRVKRTVTPVTEAEMDEARRKSVQDAKKSSWTLESVVKGSGKPPDLFCPSCGALLPQVDTTIPHVTCTLCRRREGLSCVVDRVLLSRWMPKDRVAVKKVDKVRTSIKMACANPAGCTATTVDYYQMQLRGADEGSTTFYECSKCGYNWNENN